MKPEKIEGLEKVERVMGWWSPANLSVIEELSLVKDRESGDAVLSVTALFQERGDSWPDFDDEMFRVRIAFDCVAGLCLRDFGGGWTQVMGFDIRFVGDRGLEGINYEIKDHEEGVIGFHCKGIRILSAVSAGVGGELDIGD